MRLDSEHVAGFIHDERFDLNAYLSLLFNKFNSLPKQVENQMKSKWINQQMNIGARKNRK